MRWWWKAVMLFCEWRAQASIARAEADVEAFHVWKARVWKCASRT